MEKDLTEAKADLRRLIRKSRASRAGDIAQVTADTESITGHLISQVQNNGYESITCFYPVSGEPNTLPFIKWCYANGVRVLLPSCVSDSRILKWREYNDMQMVPGMYGIYEPDSKLLDAPVVCDAMFIPAAAVGKNLLRLGWGGGYYDTTIEHLAGMGYEQPVYAVIFDDEIYPEIPAESWDLRVSGIITERGLRQ